MLVLPLPSVHVGGGSLGSSSPDLDMSPFVGRGSVMSPVTSALLLQELSEMLYTDRPDWQSVMQYVAQIYKYFET